jgi:hypothetical protein
MVLSRSRAVTLLRAAATLLDRQQLFLSRAARKAGTEKLRQRHTQRVLNAAPSLFPAGLHEERAPSAHFRRTKRPRTSMSRPVP